MKIIEIMKKIMKNNEMKVMNNIINENENVWKVMKIVLIIVNNSNNNNIVI